MFKIESILERKSILFSAICVSIIAILALPVIIPHILHGYHIIPYFSAYRRNYTSNSNMYHSFLNTAKPSKPRVINVNKCPSSARGRNSMSNRVGQVASIINTFGNLSS